MELDGDLALRARECFVVAALRLATRRISMIRRYACFHWAWALGQLVRFAC
jgi:hypothetical protein